MPQENGKNGHIFEFGKFVLDPNERILLSDGTPVHLTDKVFDTLYLLVRNNGRLLTKEQMMTSIWEESFVEEGNLVKNISRLRKILNTDESALIETVPRRGYRFAADIKELDGDTSFLVRRNLRVKIIQTTDDDGTLTTAAVGHVIEELPRASFRPRIPIAVLGTVLFALVSGLGFYYWKSIDLPPQHNNAGAIRLTDDPANDFWPNWSRDGRINFFRLGSDKHGKNILTNADGTEQTEIAFKGEPFPNYLHWSHDGSKVIFSKPGDNTATYLANADGSNEIALPLVGNTDWSADDKNIVYQRSIGEPKNSELFVYTLETGKTENITNFPGFDADPSFSPDGSQIVFASFRDGNMEVYLMNSDGSDVRRLTNHPAWDNHPVFSPDGTTIAFNADREEENSDIFLIDTEGGNLRRLTSWPSNETVGPGGWSPDGTQIAFSSDGEGNDDIYVTSAEVFGPRLVLNDKKGDLNFPSYLPDGRSIVYQSEMPDKAGEIRVYDTESKQTRVLTQTDRSDLEPVISPDGTQIAFQNKVGSNTEICLINRDGSGLTNVTQNPARDIAPSFSRDGKRISFASNRDGNTGLFRLYVMNVDGSDQRRLYQGEGFIISSAWSPDGSEIVFVKDSTGAGNFDLFSVAPDDPGSGRRLTHRPRSEGSPAVSPDGKKIAFVSISDGNYEIYLMNRDGSCPLRLTRNLADDATPQFSPDGSKIIFSSKRDGKSSLYEIDLTQ